MKGQHWNPFIIPGSNTGVEYNVSNPRYIVEDEINKHELEEHANCYASEVNCIHKNILIFSLKMQIIPRE